MLSSREMTKPPHTRRCFAGLLESTCWLSSFKWIRSRCVDKGAADYSSAMQSRFEFIPRQGCRCWKFTNYSNSRLDFPDCVRCVLYLMLLLFVASSCRMRVTSRHGADGLLSRYPLLTVRLPFADTWGGRARAVAVALAVKQLVLKALHNVNIPVAHPNTSRETEACRPALPPSETVD